LRSVHLDLEVLCRLLDEALERRETGPLKLIVFRVSVENVAVALLVGEPFLGFFGVREIKEEKVRETVEMNHSTPQETSPTSTLLSPFISSGIVPISFLS
jgi:hypothetical protein